MHHVFAQSLELFRGTSITGPLRFGNVGQVVSEVLKYVFVGAGIGLLFMIISAGFTLLTSAGDAKNMEKGKQTLTYAVVGFLIIILAYWILQMVAYIFGLGSVTTIFSPAGRR